MGQSTILVSVADVRRQTIEIVCLEEKNRRRHHLIIYAVIEIASVHTVQCTVCTLICFTFC